MTWVRALSLIFLLSSPLTAQQLLVRGAVEAGGLPLPEARVTLLPLSGAYEAATLAFEGRTPEPAAEVFSDRSGRFEIAAPDIGMWTVRVEASGYRAQEYPLRPLLDAVDLPSVELEPAREVLLRLSSGEGRVSAEPDDSNHTNFLRGRGSWHKPTQTPHADDKGRVRLSVARGEILQVRAVAAGGLGEAKVDGGKRRALQIRETAQRAVRVVDERDQPLAGVLILGRETALAFARTDERGEALVAVDEKQQLRLLGEQGRRAFVTIEPPPAEAADESLVWTLPTPARMQGRVIDRESRLPIAGALVWSADNPGEAVRTSPQGDYDLATPELDARGGALAATAMRYTVETDRFRAGDSGPTVALRPTVIVAGRVLDDERNPLADVLIEVGEKKERRGLRFFRQPFAERTAYTRGDGSFRITRLPAGTAFDLKFQSPGRASVNELVEALESFAERSDLEIVLERGRRGFGRVVDENDEPIPGAEASLTLQAETQGRGPAVFIGGARGEEEETYSADREGYFEIPDVAAGTYDLKVEAPGFSRLKVPGIEAPEGTEDVDLGLVVLVPGVGVEGVVLDVDGVPLAGAQVKVGESSTSLPPFLMKMAMRGNPTRTRSDANGRFEIEDLRVGEKVNLLVELEEYVSATVMNLEAPTDAPVEVELSPAARIRGRVIDESGMPLSDASVTVQSQGEGASGRGLGDRKQGSTDGEGRFDIGGVEAGANSVSASRAGYQGFQMSNVEVAQGEILENLELKLSPGATVTGIVSSPDGRPLIGALVRAVEPSSGSGFGGFRTMVSTDGDGRYRLDGLKNALYTVSAESEDGRTAREITLESGVNELDLVFSGGVVVSGRVSGPQGPVAGATVEMNKGGFSFNRPRATTGEDGGFSVSGVQAGTYTVYASKKGLAQTKLEGVEIAETPVDGLELQLKEGTVLRGTIVGLDFDALSELKIQVLQRGDRRSAEVNYEGSYVARNLSPGSWQINAEVASTGRRLQERVEIEDGEIEKVHNLEFGAGYRLTGTVRAGDKMLAGASVYVSGRSSSGWANATVSQDGTFVIDDLKEGLYELNVSDYGSGIRHSEEIEIDGDVDVSVELEVGRISGRIIDSYDQAPIEGARLGLRSLDGEDENSGFRRATSDSLGVFNLGAVLEGRWIVVAQRGGYAPAEVEVDLQGGGEIDDLEIEMQPTEGVYLEVFLPSGAAPSQVYAAVMRGGERLLGGTYELVDGARLRLTEVPPGTYELLVSTAETSATAVQITSPGQAGQVRLQPAGSLRLRVPDLEDDPSPATVELTDSSGARYRSLSWGGRVIDEVSLRSGETTVSRLRPGAWNVVVRADDGRTWTGSAAVAGGEALLTLD